MWFLSIQLRGCFSYSSEVQSNLFRHEAYKSSKMILTLNLKPCLEVQMRLAAVFCVFPHAILNVTETVCVQQLRFLYTLGNQFFVLCSEVCSMLMSDCWWERFSFVRKPSFSAEGTERIVNLREYLQRWIWLKQVSRMGFQTSSFIICIVPYCSHVN